MFPDSSIISTLTFAPSLMCGDLLNLSKDLLILDRHEFDYLHLDIMDGHFVPNITFGFDAVNRISALTSTPKDIHLLMDHPELAIRNLKLDKRDMVTFHIECKARPEALIRQIRAKDARVGLAINAGTPLEDIYPFLDDIDHILVMTVKAGFSGQPFIKASSNKIDELTRLIKHRLLTVSVGVDGAIGLDEIITLRRLGVNHFVLGTTSLFKEDLAAQAVKLLQLKIKLEQAQLLQS